MAKTIKNAQLLVDTLIKQGVTHIFGYPGATIAPVYEALSKRKKEIKHILVRQEQNACHMASGYARIKGVPGVCIATSGPGALNFIPAIATAYMDSIPIVVITGQVSSELVGRDVFQEADITGSAEPFVKHSYLLKSSDNIVKVINEAFFIASTGRKGPVLIDIPVDVQEKAVTESEQAEFLPPRGGYQLKKVPITERLALSHLVADKILKANLPLLCVGGGIFSANATKELSSLIVYTGLPVVTTMMGLSSISPKIFPDNYLGMIGRYGNKPANDAVKDCDLLLLIGARVGDRAIVDSDCSFKNKTIIHIDVDPAEINKNIHVDIAIHDDAKNFLSLLKSDLISQNLFKAFSTFQDYIPSLRKEGSPSQLIQLLYENMSYNAIIACDVGQHLLWCARNYSLKNGRFLTSGGMGTMGYSLPAAIGAAVASADREIVVFCGDGGFQMNMMELATLKAQGLSIKLILLDNSSLGLVKELQNEKKSKEFAVSLNTNPDFAQIFSAYNIKSTTLSLSDTLQKKEAAIKAFFKEKSACALICHIDSSYTSLD